MLPSKNVKVLALVCVCISEFHFMVCYVEGLQKGLRS